MLRDANGNVIKITNGEVKLHLLNHKPRLLGRIDDSCKTFFVKRNREEHLMQKNNSYGYNHFVLTNAKRFDKVHLTDNYGEWLIPVAFILEHGTYLHYKQIGFELQVFLHLNFLDKFKINQLTEKL